MSDVLDKSLESIFGYITPTQRLLRLQINQRGEAGPLHKYFLGDMVAARGIFTANVSKGGPYSGIVVTVDLYIYAVTDVPG